MTCRMVMDGLARCDIYDDEVSCILPRKNSLMGDFQDRFEAMAVGDIVDFSIVLLSGFCGHA